MSNSKELGGEVPQPDVSNKNKSIESIKRVIETMRDFAPTSIILLYTIHLRIENGEVSLEDIGLTEESWKKLKRDTVAAWVKTHLEEMKKIKTNYTTVERPELINWARSIITEQTKPDNDKLLNNLDTLERAVCLEEVIGIFRRIETTDSDNQTIYKIPDELATYFYREIMKWNFSYEDLGIDKKTFERITTRFN